MRTTTMGSGLVLAMATLVMGACSTEVIRVERATDAPATEGSGAEGSASGAAGSAEDPAAPTASLLDGIAVSGLAVFQGVKVDVVAKGAWVKTRNAPVVAGRPALVRAYVTPAAGWSPRSVTAELRITGTGAKSPVLRVTKTVSAASTDEAPASAFDFEVPGDVLTADATFQIALTGAGATEVSGDSDARFPKDGSMQALGAKPTGKLRVVIVPVKYDADGSGRLPDTSPAQLERYKRVFLSRYPTVDVEVTARAPFSWTTAISRNGTGFQTVLRAITQLRQDDRAPADVYYYGAFAPAPSFSQYCNAGCVLGLSAVVDDASTSLLRASVGVGYTNEESASTAAHEIGHAHGREHAPCGGAQGTDPEFPYSGGGIGVWGYDILTKTFMSPSKGKDMMGYCPNEWVSDYTYAALFDRITAVSKPTTTTASTMSARAGTQTYRLATVEADGSLGAGSDVELEEAPGGGEVKDVTYAAAGATVATRSARFYRFDHLPGGFVLFPTRIGADWSRATVRGLAGAIAR